MWFVGVINYFQSMIMFKKEGVAMKRNVGESKESNVNSN